MARAVDDNMASMHFMSGCCLIIHLHTAVYAIIHSKIQYSIIYPCFEGVFSRTAFFKNNEWVKYTTLLKSVSAQPEKKQHGPENELLFPESFQYSTVFP